MHSEQIDELYKVARESKMKHAQASTLSQLGFLVKGLFFHLKLYTFDYFFQPAYYNRIQFCKTIARRA